MNKLKVLNELEIDDWSCSLGECEYVLVDATDENIRILKDVGFTDSQIKEALGLDGDFLDISILGFNYAGADWWSRERGFYAN